jgi:hypothetical protein
LWANGVRLARDDLVVLGVPVVVAAASDVKRSAVLIFSEDPLGAALIGAAVELAGIEPAYPVRGELPREALLRQRPRLVLVDCDHGAACEAAFFGPAMMTGARVVLMASARTCPSAERLAAEFGLRSICLSSEPEAIAAVLAGELETSANKR